MELQDQESDFVYDLSRSCLNSDQCHSMYKKLGIKNTSRYTNAVKVTQVHHLPIYLSTFLSHSRYAFTS